MLVQEMGVCSGSLPRSATNLGYDMGKLFVMGVALPAQKLPLAAQKFASVSSLRQLHSCSLYPKRETRASFRASVESFSRDISWDLTVGAGLEERGDLGTLGQEWSCGEPGVACESLNLVESRREGNEASCCFWLQR